MSISEGEGRNKIFVFLFTLIILCTTPGSKVFAKSFYAEKEEFEYVVEDVECMANIYVEAYELSMNNNVVGYIRNPEVVKDIIENVKDKYSNKVSNKGFSVDEVNFDTKVDLRKNSILTSEISSADEISKMIVDINDSISNPLVKIEVEAEKEETIAIEPSVEVIKVDDMYLGDKKIEEGKEGEKVIKKKFTFINGKETGSEIVNQNIIREAESTRVYKGIKNPIVSNMAFLNHPTRGGVVTSVFGEKSRGGHRGVDIGVPTGTPIGAACDGVVTYVGYDDIYGNMVKIRHDDNTETLYAHASEVLTTVGKEVKKGETIAKVGSTGRSTGPHLHLELIYKGNPINPVDYII